jgi:tetratricopeptide (TPR) repeat protein
MKKLYIIIFTLALIISMSCWQLHAQENEHDNSDVSHIFLKANQAYKDGDFNKAADLYKKLLTLGISNGSMYYNLGNAYLKTGSIGKALASYRKAELFLPRDEDLQANIQYAQQQTTDKIEGREPYAVLKSFCFWYERLSIRELVVVFLVVNALLWGTAILRLFYNWDYLGIVLSILLFFTVLMGISSAIKLYAFYGTAGGVVTIREITVRSGSSINDTALFQLHEGAEFEWVEENEGWVKIQLRDGKKGWVQKETVEKISLS